MANMLAGAGGESTDRDEANQDEADQEGAGQDRADHDATDEDAAGLISDMMEVFEERYSIMENVVHAAMR
jgi:hypothetical protein